MAFWIVILVALVALGALVLYVLREQSIERERIDKELHDERTPTLEYSVPTGQDPVSILAALERAGYTASVDPHHPHQHVLIACPEGVDQQRAHVRSVIESASVTAPEDGAPLEVDVRFKDEG
jgi:hypothetical protein